MRLVRIFAAVIASLVLIAAGAVVLYALSVPGAASPVDARRAPPGATFTVVAIGDSYMSGEGAPAFYRGTDVPGTDSCRRAPTAYPVRVADALRARLVFAACSGAETENVGTTFPRSGKMPAVQYASEPLQLRALEAHPEADVILVSLGGNDALFSKIVALCSGKRRSCVPQATDWMDGLGSVVQPALRDVYAQIRTIASPRARIFVTTYPRPFPASVRTCPRVGMEGDEVRFLRTFVTRLDAEITLAAADAGFEVIDLSGALDQDGLCASAKAINGWREQRTEGLPRELIDPLRGSFHPTAYGHELMARTVLARVRERIAANDPIQTGPGLPPTLPLDASGPGGPPSLPPGGAGPPGVPPNLPPYVPDEVGPPLPPFPQDENPCTPSTELRDIVVLDARTDYLTGVRPGSLVCSRTYQGDWRTQRAEADGTAVVRFERAATEGIGGYRRVLYRDRADIWVQRVLRPGTSADPPRVSLLQAWLASRDIPLLVLVVVVSVVGFALLTRTVLQWLPGGSTTRAAA